MLDAIQNSYRRAAIQKSLFVELHDLRCKLAMGTFLLAERTGTLNRELLLWLEPIEKSYQGFYAQPDFGKGIQGLLKLNDQQLQELCKQSADRGLSLKKYALPFLELHLSSLPLFSPEFQRNALEIRAQLSAINEEIDLVRFYQAKTYDSSVTPENYEIIRSSIKRLYGDIGRMWRDLADNTGKLLQREN